jgi:hypothetical protein
LNRQNIIKAPPLQEVNDGQNRNSTIQGKPHKKQIGQLKQTQGRPKATGTKTKETNQNYN